MKVRCNHCMKVFDEEKIVYDGEDDMEYCPECGESGFLMDMVDIRYHICGLCYDENDCIKDGEMYIDDFDTYEEAYEKFVRLQCKDAGWFFEGAPSVYKMLIQLEECEEDDEEIRCIDVKNEWWIINPNFKEEM